jgi:hypothetical protein
VEHPRTLVGNLRLLNRKERFFLIGQALGKSSFELSTGFRRTLEERFSLTIPEDAFVAMDYHLNWLYAALVLTYLPEESAPHANDRGIVQGNQEDVDLLVAWEEPDAAHVVMVEAKGATSYSNGQTQHKFERLTMIFGADGRSWKNVHPHFGLMSPRPPRLLRTEGIPDWALQDGAFAWLRMDMPAGLKAVMRCNEAGQPSATGTHWTLKHG